MTRTLHRLGNVAGAALAFSIIALAMLSVIARLLLPHAEGLRDSLIEHLSVTLGTPVEVGTFSIRLRGLTPELSFTNARLLAPSKASGGRGETLLAARALRIDLDLSASALAGRPRIEAISLVGAKLQVLREADGGIRVLGLGAMQNNDAQALDFFLREGHFRLLDSELTWRDLSTQAPAQTFQIDSAELANQSDHHELRLRAVRLGSSGPQPPAAAAASERRRAGRLEILGRLQGPAQHPGRWSGRLYLSAVGGDLGPLANGLLPARLELRSAGFRLESWTRLEQGRVVDSIIRVGIDALDLDAAQIGQQVRLGDLGGIARWQRQTQGWQLAIDDLRLPGRQPPTAARASLRLRRAPTGAVDPTPAQQGAPESERSQVSATASGPASAAELLVRIGALEIGPIAKVISLLAPDLPAPVIALGQGRLQGLARTVALRMALGTDADADADKAPTPVAGRSTALGQPALSARSDSLQQRSHSGRPPTEPEWDWTALRVSDWRLGAELENLVIDAQAAPATAAETAQQAAVSATEPTATTSPLPSVAGLDLRLDIGPRGGHVEVAGSDVLVDLRPMFALPQRFTQLDGEFSWRLMPAGSIHLWTEALSANTTDLQTLSRLSLCLHPSGANPFIDLHTHLRDGQISALPYWLPVGIMDDRLEDWLQQAIVAGELESGDLLLRGPLERFPFDDQEGRFILELRAVDGVLDYDVHGPPSGAAPELSSSAQGAPLRWPPLQQVSATLRFENRSLEIEVPSAEILNTQVDAGRVSMPNLWQPTYLEIDARGEGPLADGLHVLATTPLADRLGGLASAARVSGDGGIHLQLGVPLSRGLPFRYAGELIWPPDAEASAAQSADPALEHGAGDGDDGLGAGLGGASEERTLSLTDFDLRFSRITGRLRFDESGLEAQGIRAHLGQQALEVDVDTIDGGRDSARTQISLRGRAEVAQLAEVLPSSLWSLASGALPWRLALSLSNRDAAHKRPPIDFSLSSDLEGLKLSLPAPVGKRSIEARRFQLSGRFADRWPLELELAYGQMGALMELDRQPGGAILLHRLAVDLNGQPTRLPPRRTIEISGQLERLQLDPWLSWSATADLEPRPGSQAEGELRLLPVHLQVQDLQLDALQLSDLDATLTPQPNGGWDIRFSALQTGDSQITLPAASAGAGQPLRIRVEEVDLEPLLEAYEQKSPERAARSRTDPRQFGRLDLEIDQLRYGDDLLGQLRILSQPMPNGVHFDTLSLTGPHVDATGQGQWLIDATDYIESSLQVNAESSAVGELLRESGFYSALSGAPGQLELDLSWPGGPGELSLARARGSMQLEIGSGRLLEMEPGVGRMLGILNTAALGRRLSLDFSDVFEDGFSFDSISGEIAIGSGEATIRDLNILAPPADVRITGRTDLVDGVLDQEVEVTPKIGVGLALAGAVAGGPVVGAAVFLADKVTDGAVERLGRYAYQVTGPWRDPIIRRVGTSGSPSVGNLFVDDTVPQSSAGYRAQPDAGSGTASETGRTAPPATEQPVNPFLDDL